MGKRKYFIHALFLTSLLLPTQIFSQTIITWLDDSPEPSFGTYFYVTGHFDFNISTIGDLWFDISFPGGIDKVEIVDKNDWGADSKVFIPGDKIYHRTSGEMTATYHLVSAHLSGYTGLEDLDIKLKVYPNISGELKMYHRGTFKINSTLVTDPLDGKGWTIDQQGWDVYMHQHTHNPLPDLYISTLKVNEDLPIVGGVDVKIESKIGDLNDIGSGKAKVNYYLDGSLIGSSTTDNLVPANGSTIANLIYKFPDETKTYKLKAITDPDNTIQESENNNNSKEINISVITEPKQFTLEFSGYTWNVRTEKGNPDNNYWWNSKNSVWVDAEGQLHLKIRKIGVNWYSSEVFLQKSLGYGEYRFYLGTNVELLDPNLVVGLFIYENDNKEFDIEFSRWKNPSITKVGNYVTQSSSPQSPKGLVEFPLNLTGNLSTHKIKWNSSSVLFQSYHGHYPNIPTNDYFIKDWTYSGGNNFSPNNERAYINFWLSQATPPANNAEAEIIIKSFSFTGITETKDPALSINEYSLSQNYPNPFNPSTVIEFQIPNADHVTIYLYDIIGRKIKTLFNGSISQGRYSINVDGSDLSTGIYYYEMNSGLYHSFKKMIFIK